MLPTRIGMASSEQYDLAPYASSISSAVLQEDGRRLASLLSTAYSDNTAVLLSYTPNTASQYTQAESDSPYLQDFKRCLAHAEFGRLGQYHWADVASRHTAVVLYLYSEQSNNAEPITGPDWDRAFFAQLNMLKSFLAWFSDASNASSGWALPVLYRTCSDLKNIASKADKVLLRQNNGAARLEEASRLITKCWTACLNDRAGPSAVTGKVRRNMGAYYIATLLFKIYFELETLGLLKNIVRGIQNQADLPPLSSYPRSHQVAYRYYMGVYDFLNERYGEAEEHLAFAAGACLMSSQTNMRLILSYLIPVRMLRGSLPSEYLLSRHFGLAELYRPFVQAYRTGNVQWYDSALLQSRAALVKAGTYLTVERAREGCLRILFKRVWLCTDKSSRLSIATAQRALVHVQVAVDSDEVECLIANLIYKGHIRGYLSHERQTLVLAKSNAFPAPAKLAST